MRTTSRRHYNSGVSLIEVMVSVALGLLVLAAMSYAFVNSSRARSEIQKTGQQIENGRYATQQLIEDLRLAGYYVELNPTVLATPATLPDPCDYTSSSLSDAIALPVQGYNNATSGTLTCLSGQSVRANSDILVLRRASTCVQGSAGCEAMDVSKYFYFQKSLCVNTITQYVIDNVAGSFTLQKPDCSTVADIRSFVTRIYFVSDNNKTYGTEGDGIPTLKVAELGATGFTIMPLATGIDQMKLEYGIRTAAATAPTYTTNPGTYNACTSTACQTNWRNVTAVKVHILARNTESTGGYSDVKVYVLGTSTFGPFNDAYKRHAFTTVARLNNVEGRFE